ncbi:MAG: CHAT domain-containing protein [Chloroflexi bacterium]|nr:CHAT domain-containing protein [Chloroflexota bacterium]
MSSYKTRQAQRAIDRFAERYGQARLDFACHAALPLALTPDLLYALWFNFNEDVNGVPLNVPWIAVANLLLSPLCQEVGYELYAIEQPIRDALAQKLIDNERFGLKRAQQIAQFLDQYVDRFFISDDLDTQELGQAQRLAAYAFANPQQLVAYLDAVYQRPLSTPQMIRFASLVESVSYPIANWHTAEPETKTQFARAQTISQSLAAYARGDVATAVSTLQANFATLDDVAIRETAVPLPADLLGSLTPPPTDNPDTTAAALRQYFDDYLSRLLFDVSGKLETALRAIARWLAEPNDAPIMVITGQPGSGKTNLAANFVKTMQAGGQSFPLNAQTFGGYHFCQDDRPETVDPQLFVRTLSQQLAERFVSFRTFLPADPPAATATLEELTDQLLTQPLQRLLALPNRSATDPYQSSFSPTDPYESPFMADYLVVLVDDLDAAVSYAGNLCIVDVCLRLQTAVPRLRFLFTTHLSSEVRDLLNAARYATYTLDTVYVNFDVRIEDAGTKRQAYAVRVLASPAGEMRPKIVYDGDSLARRIVDELRRIHQGTPRQPIGVDLFETFLKGEVESLFRAAYEQAQRAGNRLRLRLSLGDADLAALPWEWLYTKDLGFLAQREDISVVRYVAQTAVFRTRANPQPIETLLAVANPTSEAPWDAEKLVHQVQSALSGLSGKVDLSVVQSVSRRALQARLDGGPVHVLHLAASAANVQGELRWALDDDAGQLWLASAAELAALLKGNELALVMVTAVNAEQWSPVLLAAQKLVEAGVPAVLVWPSPVPDDLLVGLLAAFYESLAQGAWLDTAVSDMRRAALSRTEGQESGPDLALFTSTEHGNVWRSELTAVDLYEALTENFTLNDLQELCFGLQIDFNSLEGEGRRGKMVSLVKLSQREDRFQELALAILDARPNVNFAYRSQKEAPAPSTAASPDTLAQWLVTLFNLEEIQILCLKLQLAYDDLAGSRKSDTVQNLVSLMARNGRLPDLEAAVVQERPFLAAPPPAQSAQESLEIDPITLYRQIAESFNLQEIEALAAQIGIQYDDLAGNTSRQKARELVLYMQRHGRLPELLEAVQQLQPVTEKSAAISFNVSQATNDAPMVTFGPNQPDAKEVAALLEETFSLDELKTLSFELQIDFENLEGSTKAAKGRSLVEMAQDQNRLSDLINTVGTNRPGIGRGDFSEAA